MNNSMLLVREVCSRGWCMYVMCQYFYKKIILIICIYRWKVEATLNQYKLYCHDYKRQKSKYIANEGFFSFAIPNICSTNTYKKLK